MGNKKYNLSFLLIIFIVACRAGHEENVTPAIGPFEAYKNIMYGTDSLQQNMDVYLPLQRDATNTPVIILLHGGSWVTGDKNDFSTFGLDTFFTASGCALVNMNYRLDWKYKFPAPIDDIGLVMDCIKQKAGGWKINGDRVCLLGRSVGSHLALLYAYTRNGDNRIKAVIDGFGPSDLTDSSVAYAALGINVTFLLGPYSSNGQAWRDYGPINHLEGALPTVIIQGTADSLVFPVQSHILEDSLLSRGVPYMYVSWAGAPHGWIQSDWLQWRDTILSWVKRFL